MLDLLIKNAKMITNEVADIGILNGKIAKAAENISEPSKKTIQLSKDEYLSAGWIDDHVHCYEKMTLYYDYPDEIGVKKGVTTVIDAGSTGASNIDDFYAFAKKAETNVYALLNISAAGIIQQNELADLSKIQGGAVQQKITQYPDFIVGIKARMSRSVIGENGITPLEMAKKIQGENHHLPLMVHIGSEPPELEEILSRLDKGDVLTHCFNGKSNGILDQQGKIKDSVWQAFKQGVIFDIGHGTDSFNFHVAEKALAEGLKAKSISTDSYIRNRLDGPVFDMATTLEKLHAVGYSWEEIIEMVTVAPAENFRLTGKGHIKAGFDADFTIFTFTNKKKKLTDSNGDTRVANEQIIPVKTIIGGKIFNNQQFNQSMK